MSVSWNAAFNKHCSCVCWQCERYYGAERYSAGRRQHRTVRHEQPHPRRDLRLVLPASVRVHVRRPPYILPRPWLARASSPKWPFLRGSRLDHRSIMYVVCLLIVIVLYVAVFGAVQRQRSRRQKRRSHQLAATTASRSLVTTTAAAERRMPTAQVTEMVTVNPDKEGRGGPVDGTNVMVVEQETEAPPAVVQTSKSN